MKKVALMTLVLLFFPALALAQAAANAPAEVSINDLLAQALGTVSTWKAAGWLAGSTALVNVLMNVLKYKPVADFLAGLKIGWWLRPALAIVLGIAAGILSGVVGGAPVGMSVLVALLSGFGSTGFHELMTILNSRVQAERGVGAIVVSALTAVPASSGNGVPAADPVADLKAKLSDIEKLPPEARLAALAMLGKKA